MEFKDEELSVVAQSTLKFAKEEAEREFEKVRQKYIKKRKSNAVHLTTSVEDYENTLTELRLKHLKEDLNAYFDINPKLYAYVCAINAKEELNFIHEHNKIHRHDVGRETIMKEIVTRRFDSVKVDNQLEKTKYEKEKYEKEEERDYQHRLDIEKVAKELLQQANKEDLLVESYATIYSNLVQEFEKICDENKAEMDSLFEKVNLLVKENFKKIAFTAEKTKITEIAKDRDQKARDLLAIHRQDIDNNVDYKVLKVQLREKLPVEEKLKKVEEQKEVYKKQIQDLETQINQLNEEIQTIEKAIDEKRKENQKEFVERVDFSELNNVTTEEAEVLHKINSCFVKESEEIFDALIEIINEYGKKNFVPFDIYKKEHIQNYDQQIQTINETLKTFIQPIDEKKKEKEIIAPLDTEISMALRNTNCGKYKLRELTTDFFDSQNPDYKYDSSHMSQALTGVLLAIDLPEEEYQLQTIAYQFAADFNEAEFSDEIYQIGSIPNVTLRRFGILPDSKELFAEISIYSANADPDSLSASLKGRADALYSEISGEEDAVLYLKEQRISSVTISFYTPWDRTVDPPYHTFSYQIQ